VVALVIEDGTAKADATTLNSRAELIAFAAQRGIAIPDSDATDVHLVKATDYLATLSFLGNPVSAGQGTPFPRTFYPSAESDDLGFPNDSVPAPVKRAHLFLALASYQGVTLLDQRSAGRQLKSRDVGPLKRSYGEESFTHAEVAGVMPLLTPYITPAGGFRLTVGRA
jgi:hypothetical protein